MKIYYIIEWAIRPGSFYSTDYSAFKGFIFATRFSDKRQALKVIEDDGIESCKITEIYERK